MSESNRATRLPSNAKAAPEPQTPAAPKRSGIVTAAVGWALFIAFLTYFNLTSSALPHGAGPDYAAHDDASRFIFENHRLAQLPEDEAELNFTPYGGTRALRPPLSYIVSAAVAKALQSSQKKLEILFRKGSALFCALTVLVLFQTLVVFFNSYKLATFGAIAIGLLPQFTFIASYNNDDAGAIFSASMMILAMTVVFRNGVSVKSLALMGLAAGLVIITKPSAWIIAPSVLLFAALFIFTKLPKALGPMLIGLLVMAVTGGWWIAMNVHHYGINDPLLQKVIKTTAEKHSRFDDDKKFGYAAHGVTMVQLLKNHGGFLEGTGLSTIGNLDWLRLRVGKHVYWFYYALGALGVIYWLLRVLSIVRPGSLPRPSDLIFETILILTIGFQFYMYMWANMYNDIQIQGKYLLPVVGALLILSLCALRAAGSIAWSIADRAGAGRISFTQGGVGIFAILALIAAAFALHRDSLVNHVLPFYQPAFYQEPLRPVAVKPFKRITINPGRFKAANQIDNARLDGKKLVFESTGSDPWFVPSLKNCGGASDNTLVRIVMTAPDKGRFSIYWDDGNGFSDQARTTVRYNSGRQELHIWIAPRSCQQLRFDPGVAPGDFVIHRVSIAQIDIGPRAD